MSETALHIKRIQEKLQGLVKHSGSLSKENTKLKEEIAALKNQQAALLNELDQVRETNLILKASAGTMPQEEHKAFEKRISQYLKEIDHCIAILSE